MTTLATFNFANGYNPNGGLIEDQKGDFLGTTLGTVFKMTPDGTLSTLASFTDNGGANPETGLTIDGNGNLFGTTRRGGTLNSGVVFELTAGSHSLSILDSFSDSTGKNPVSGVLMDHAGNLFGTTETAGPGLANGTIYELPSGSNALAALAGFHDGQIASGLVEDGAGDFFGVTQNGGVNHLGTVFELAAGSNTIIKLATFNGQNGSGPCSSLTIDGNGNLYGMTRAGGSAGLGTVYEISAGSSAITTLASFTSSNGTSWSGPLCAIQTAISLGSRRWAELPTTGPSLRFAPGLAPCSRLPHSPMLTEHTQQGA